MVEEVACKMMNVGQHVLIENNGGKMDEPVQTWHDPIHEQCRCETTLFTY